MAFAEVPGSSPGGTRRARVSCPHCSATTEIGKLRDHLRAEHRLASTELDQEFLSALMDVRRARRSRG